MITENQERKIRMHDRCPQCNQGRMMVPKTKVVKGGQLNRMRLLKCNNCGATAVEVVVIDEEGYVLRE